MVLQERTVIMFQEKEEVQEEQEEQEDNKLQLLGYNYLFIIFILKL